MFFLLGITACTKSDGPASIKLSCADKEVFEDPPLMTTMWSIVFAGTSGLEYYGTYGESGQPKESTNGFIPGTLVFFAEIAEGTFHKYSGNDTLEINLYNHRKIKFRQEYCGRLETKTDTTLIDSDTTSVDSGSVSIVGVCSGSYYCDDLRIGD